LGQCRIAWLGLGLAVLLSACTVGRSGVPVTVQPAVPQGGTASPTRFGSPEIMAQYAEKNPGLIAAGLTDSYSKIEFVAVEKFASVFNPFTNGAFTVFDTIKRSAVVNDDSSATIDIARDGSVEFTTSDDRAAWIRDKRPDVWGVPSEGTSESFSPGNYDLIPKGSTLTFKDAISLPQSVSQVSKSLWKYVRPRGSSSATISQYVTVLADNYSFLLAAAPLTQGTRIAIWQAITTLPGLHFCGTGKDLLGRPGNLICVAGSGDETEILVDMKSLSVLGVKDILTSASQAYPEVAAGSVIDDWAFISAQIS